MRATLRAVLLAVTLSLLGAEWNSIAAQPTYSIDWQSPTKGMPDSIFGFPITEGDLLTFPPGAPPAIVAVAGFVPVVPPVPGLFLPFYMPGVSVPGVPGMVEVDALSFGADFRLDPGQPHLWYYSVDEFATGLLGTPPPSVGTEGVAGFTEASADIFNDFPGVFPAGYPQPPGAIGPFSMGVFDGNGAFPFGGPGLGLIEPNPPTVPPPFPALPDPGDNLDAHDIDFPVMTGPGVGFSYPVYYSLDSVLFDPIEMVANSGSAAANGAAVGIPFPSGGDVWVSAGPGTPPALYAPAMALGLDLFGVDTDDLDALVLSENGDGFYTPYAMPFDWLGGGTDLLLFSVRRGSAIIGVGDAFFGLPIEEGDILIPPPAFLPPGTPPGIWVPAENLGLATVRSLVPTAFPFGDDLNALDLASDCNMNGISDQLEIASGAAADCNMNGLLDDCDIAAGTSLDCNSNLIPDECEVDCNMNGIPDDCDIANSTSADCNMNGIPDECDITSSTSDDCNSNMIPDECEPDCNMNGSPDDCDIASGTSLDCNLNMIPDECETDCNSNGVPDDCDIAIGTSLDCNSNGIPDECDLSMGTSMDCNSNMVPDECELDCNMNGTPDECDLANGTSQDCNMNGIPDECDIASTVSDDCNMNMIPDECEVDCNSNGVPDDCDIAVGTSLDCNSNTVPDECDLSAGTSLDCNANMIPDECDIASATSADCNSNTIPDECETDCNTNGVPDDCDIATGTSADTNMNGIPDECEMMGGFIRGDCNADGAYNIADPILLLAFLFPPAGSAPPCDDACDCNDDGTLNIADTVCLLSGLFGTVTVPPAPPHPGCGPDPTPGDPLSCTSFPPCP